jgi:hypothetical protein
MKIRQPVLIWIQNHGINVTDDGEGVEKGTICLSAQSSLAFQNGCVFV